MLLPPITTVPVPVFVTAAVPVIPAKPTASCVCDPLGTLRTTFAGVTTEPRTVIVMVLAVAPGRSSSETASE